MEKLPRSTTPLSPNRELEVELDNVARHGIYARIADLFHDMMIGRGDVPRHPDPCQRESQRDHLVLGKKNEKRRVQQGKATMLCFHGHPLQ